jgi:hypothetical protein
MTSKKREGNRPDRRILPDKATNHDERRRLLEAMRYGGSANHKLRPGDYALEPPANPRATKSVCDDLRPLLAGEARTLFTHGVLLGMLSAFAPGSVPKYVWAVDERDEVYEAKTRPETESVYHGYRLGDDEKAMRARVLAEWRERCKTR